jgi:hypothetical protein
VYLDFATTEGPVAMTCVDPQELSGKVRSLTFRAFKPSS